MQLLPPTKGTTGTMFVLFERQLPQEIIDALEAVMVGEHLDPIASTMDFVMWMR
jgi:hypothetical protein